MKYIEWNKDKNDKLKRERNISFEEVVILIQDGKERDVIDNPSSHFPNQKIYVVEVHDYIYYVPYVEDEHKIFLKTIIPSRKATKKYKSK
ncbi:MAG TPA: BrnT family toxin [Candidatus Woesebacteria bacterium]|nr:BrnT family toxin [Candidatus Woesebacteria bacterium]